jgi:hypothetical protein
MTVRTTGGSPAPPRRRAGPFGPPPSTAPAPDAGAGTPDQGAPGQGAPDLGAPDDGTPVAPTAGVAASAPPGPDAPAPGLRSADEDRVELARETRKELREARHRRRQLMAACAAVVAACLLLTILIVTMARQRPSGLPTPTAPRATAVVTYRFASDPIPSQSAVAPPGGHH